jgi:hypothetical protein
VSGDVRLFDREGRPLLVDIERRLGVTLSRGVAHDPSAPSAASPYLVHNHGVAGAGLRFWKAFGYTAAPGQFIQFHDAAALPANGVRPVVSRLTASGLGQNWEISFADGYEVENGIWIVGSSTGPALTLSPAVHMHVVISYSLS